MFEALSENYMSTEGRPIDVLELVRRNHPVALHGVGMSIGSVDGSPKNYLATLKELIERIDPFLVSDHLCWTGLQGRPTHDLLPLPYTEEAIRTVVENIDRAQSFLGQKIAIENVSTYMRYKHSEMTEWQFITEIQKRSDCLLLLDVNNVYVNSQNHGFDGRDFIDALPLHAVRQMHLAGHTDTGEFLFDTHSARVCEEVWELLKHTRSKMSHSPALLVEWDEDIPDWPTLEAEAVKAREVWTA